MSELLESVRDIKQLPIFPLPIVLMPLEILPLHIFEERYREMLVDAHAGKKLFGVHFFEPANEFEKLPEPGTVGCVAEIRDVQSMPDGKSNILTNGLLRYRLNGIVDSEKLYTIGEIEFFEDEPEDEAETLKIADEVFALFRRIAKAAFRMSGTPGQFPEIERTEPEPMSFLITAAFNLDNVKKYELLEMTSTIERLTRLNNLLKGAADQIESSADIQDISRTNGHSKKKIEL
jgi:Lon protease-like protein